MEKKMLFPKIGGILHGGDYNPDQWLDRPDILAQDVEYFKKAGINSVSLGIFAWSTYEPTDGEYHLDWMEQIMDNLYENGIYTILATPSGARPAWLDEKYPDCMRVDSYGVRNHHGERHNHCMSSPNFRRKLSQLNQRLAERFAHHPGLLMWHISNEFGGECYCDLCANRFREYLREKFHNDINELNKAWWTAFWSHTFNSFEQIEPPYINGETGLMGLNLEWKRFTTWNMTDCMKSEIDVVRKANPSIPVTANLMKMFNGLDYRYLAKEIDVVSWDNYPRFHNDYESFDHTIRESAFDHSVMRGLKKDMPFMLMESTPSLVNWQPYNKLKRPGVHRLACLQAVATGSDTVQYFQLRKGRGSYEQYHGAVIDHAGIDNRVFREVAEVGEILKKIAPVAGTTVKAQVAMLFDWDNRWSIQDMKAMCNDNKKYERVLVDMWKEFQRTGVEIDVISSLDDYSEYKVILAPMLYMLHPGVADKLKAFVKNGGQLLCTYLTGYINEHQLCHLGGFPGEGLAELFGLYAEEMDTLYPTDRNQIRYTAADRSYCGKTAEVTDCCEILKVTDATILAKYEDDFYKDTPAITVKSHGTGNAYYVAARIPAKNMVPLFTEMIQSVGITAKEVPENVEYHVRSGEEGTYEFYLNTTSVPLAVDGVKGYDLVSETELDGTVLLSGYGVAVVRL